MAAKLIANIVEYGSLQSTQLPHGELVEPRRAGMPSITQLRFKLVLNGAIDCTQRVGEHCRWVDFQRTRKCDEFNDVETALATFNLRHIGLRLLQPVCDGLLGKSRRPSSGNKNSQEIGIRL
jgi:hypothetical protein